jgi:hypothetical protein
VDVVKSVLPLGNQEWACVVDQYNRYATENSQANRELDPIKLKFCALVNHSKPTGKPNIPPHVRKAKETQLAMDKQAHLLALNDKEYVFCCCSLPLGLVDANVLTLCNFFRNGVGAPIPMLLDDSTQDTQNVDEAE